MPFPLHRMSGLWDSTCKLRERARERARERREGSFPATLGCYSNVVIIFADFNEVIYFENFGQIWIEGERAFSLHVLSKRPGDLTERDRERERQKGMYLPLAPFLSFSFCISISPSIPLSLSLSLTLSFCFSLTLSLSLSLSLSDSLALPHALSGKNDLSLTSARLQSDHVSFQDA